MLGCRGLQLQGSMPLAQPSRAAVNLHLPAYSPLQRHRCCGTEASRQRHTPQQVRLASAPTIPLRRNASSSAIWGTLTGSCRGCCSNSMWLALMCKLQNLVDDRECQTHVWDFVNQVTPVGQRAQAWRGSCLMRGYALEMVHGVHIPTA